MNLIQELLNILDRKEDKKSLDLKRDWFEFGRTKPSSVGNPLYSPKMTPHAIRYDDLKCNIISGLVEGTGTEHTLPMWSTVNASNCGVQTIVDSIFSQDAGATEGKVSGDFRVTGNTVLEGDLLVLGQQTIVESTVVQVADNIFRINSGGSPIDAGIEVIVPAGTKQFFFRDSDQYWTLDGESLDLHNIRIHNAIEMDGEVLINVVNEAEGLASNDNDKSIATVAAIIDYFQTNDSYVSNVQLSGTDMIFTGVNNGFSGTLDLSSLGKTYRVEPGVSPGGGVYGLINTVENGVVVDTFKVAPQNEWIKIDSDGSELTIGHKDGVVPTVNTLAQTINNNNVLTTFQYLFDDAGHIEEITRLDTTISINVPTPSVDYISNVQVLTGGILEFTGTGNAFSGLVDLSAMYDDQIVSLTGAGGITISGTYPNFTIDGSSISGGGISLTDIVAGAKMLVSINGVAQTATISHQTTTTTPTTSTQTLAHSGTFEAIVDVTHDAYGHITGYDTRTFTLPASGASTDGVISNVTFNSSTSELAFTGSTGAFNGTIDLSALADGITYSATDGIQLINPTTFGLVDVTRTNSSNSITPNHTDSFTVIDDITTNSKGQVTNVNVKTVTLPASGTGADGVITNVQYLAGGVLEFTGSNGGFNGLVDISELGADTNSTYSLGLVAGGANDTVVKLTGANGGADSQFTLAGGTGITVTENTSTNTIVISNSATETLTSLAINANTLTYTDENGNDTDIDLSLYLDDTNLARLVSGTLDGATGIATFTRDDASTFTVDFSSLIDVDTNTTYDLGAVGAAGNINIALSGSDSTNDVVTIQAGTNITLTDNGANTFTIDAASGGSSYTFGTYLTETAGTVNHDATTRSDSASAQSPAHGDVIRVVDNVTTNATGHVTAINLNTITLPKSDAGNVACSAGMALNGSQGLNGVFQTLGMGNSYVLGFEQNSSDTRHWNITWTLEYAMTGTSGVKAFNTALRITPAGGSPGTPIDWEDSAYMVSEYKVTRTYSYTVANLGQGDRVEVLVSGTSGVNVTKGVMNVVAVDCEAFGAGEVVLISNR